MSIFSSLTSKLLLAASAIVPAAGYGGYCAYDYCYPTFHSLMEKEGYEWSPISGDLGSDKVYYKKTKDIFKNLGGDWRCSKQLFEDSISPTTNVDTVTGSDNEDVPSSSINSITPNDNYEGCLVADLRHARDTSKKAGFIKWELALRSGDRGFIYAGYFSIGSIKEADGTTQEKISQRSYSIVFEVQKEENKWDIKRGLSWPDFFSSYNGQATSSQSTLTSGFANVEIKITLPNKYEWTSNGNICALTSEAPEEQCPSKDQWVFKNYVGFWEKNDEGEQAINAIKIAAKEKGKGEEHLHDIWSQDKFDFSTSTQVFDEKAAWNGSISSVYDVATKKWKGTNAAQLTNATDYLKSIYAPWANKKGTWTEASEVCSQSNSRTLKKTDSEAARLLNFCYKEKK